MDSPTVYEGLFDHMIASYDDVDPGLMMREPALKCNGSVFLFYYEAKSAMCFKLGKHYPIESHGIDEWSHLSPFRKKPPMAAWYIVGEQFGDKWGTLSETALNLMRK